MHRVLTGEIEVKKKRFSRKLIVAAFPAAVLMAPFAPAEAQMQAPSAPIAFVVYRDPWPAGRKRFWDMSNDPKRQFNDWLTKTTPKVPSGAFRYGGNPTVTLTYDTAPLVPFFVGHIDAIGLKPNFCYQLKLAGKPVYGSRGMGLGTSYVDLNGATHAVNGTDGTPTPVNGDDWANEQIGYAGRWWDETNQSGGTNNADYIYTDNYKTPVSSGDLGSVHTVYGYHFLGSFVTNSKGKAHVDFNGKWSYHIDWASWQGGNQDRFHGRFPIQGWLINSSPTRYYGYGAQAPVTSVELWYEYEASRQNPDGTPKSVRLKPGTYHCRFLLTEETFHNYPDGGDSELGGYWKTVMATEDFAYNANYKLIGPDTNAANDVVFTIK